ncbi:MAG: hypothetical protein ACLFQQ_23505, partial [Desulfococcaceae bacterium]
ALSKNIIHHYPQILGTKDGAKSKLNHPQIQTPTPKGRTTANKAVVRPFPLRIAPGRRRDRNDKQGGIRNHPNPLFENWI